MCYCGLFIISKTGIKLNKIYPDFISAIEVTLIGYDTLEYCRYIDNNSHFYNFCNGIILDIKISKFRSTNCINVL